jgi:flavodoxin
MKTAVFYYSRTGKTKVTAEALAEKISGELIQIEDLKSRKGIIGWLKAGRDARSDNITQIEPSSFDTSNYDILCFGTPVWAGKPTPAFNTMIKNFEIIGKDVIIFLTCNRTYEKPLEIMSNAVKSEGGNVIKKFAIIESGKKSDQDIKNEINDLKILD